MKQREVERETRIKKNKKSWPGRAYQFLPRENKSLSRSATKTHPMGTSFCIENTICRILRYRKLKVIQKVANMQRTFIRSCSSTVRHRKGKSGKRASAFLEKSLVFFSTICLLFVLINEKSVEDSAFKSVRFD